MLKVCSKHLKDDPQKCHHVVLGASTQDTFLRSLLMM